jgi:hypothetical protein
MDTIAPLWTLFTCTILFHLPISDSSRSESGAAHGLFASLPSGGFLQQYERFLRADKAIALIV